MPNPFACLVVQLTPKRRWAQFSLGSLFLVVTALCVWLGVVVNRAQRQKDAVTSVESLGGKVEYAEPDIATFPRTFLERWLSRDYFDEVIGIDLEGAEIADAGLQHLRGLGRLQSLSLRHTGVTDEALVYAEGLTHLEELYLDGTQITGTGLAHLQSLTSLHLLRLDHTLTTDPALGNLRGLTTLQQLFLSYTHVTDAGLAHLKGLIEPDIVNGKSSGVDTIGA